MIQVIKKWVITIWATSITLNEFKIYDNHYSNVLRLLAQMDFGDNVTHIDISEANQ